MENNENKLMLLNKHNAMIKAKYNLNASELRMYLFILYNIQMEVEVYKSNKRIKKYDHHITISIEREKFLEVSSSKQYIEKAKLEKIFESLRQKPVYYEVERENGKKDWSVFGFILKYSYRSADDSHIIHIDNVIYDMLITYKSFGYTPLNLALMFSLKGIYSYRLYELLRLWSNTKQIITYGVDEIKKYFMIDKKKSYATYANFKNKVILPAIKELNELELFDITIEEYKVGKKVASIGFLVKDLDSRKYFENNVMNISESNSKVREKNNPMDTEKNEIKDFYIPDKTTFTKGTIRMFKTDFKEFDFKNYIYEQAFNKAIAISFERDDTDVISIKNYDFFKSTLSNKISEVIIHQKEDLRFKEELDKYWDDEDVKKEEREIDYSKDPVRLETVRRNLFDQGLVNEEGYYYK
ncbi:replication initiation protein [Clostridioides difficile]|nr:replication initiation protein [Clostridioides difficile]HBH3246279.1 replication initiation protein [Clostridioides difficile]